MRYEKKFLGEIKPTFMSCEKDTQEIFEKLFIKSYPYSEQLKRLLIINTKDCLDSDNPAYKDRLDNTSLADMVDEGYIRTAPLLEMEENEEVKSYILITYDNFTPTENLEFVDCTIMIDVMCNLKYWDIGNFRQRPLKIAGIINGILDESRLSGIGTLEFSGCNEVVLSQNLAGYCLVYRAVHGEDDKIPREE